MGFSENIRNFCYFYDTLDTPLPCAVRADEFLRELECGRWIFSALTWGNVSNKRILALAYNCVHTFCLIAYATHSEVVRVYCS
jgi:hypothetical protein